LFVFQLYAPFFLSALLVFVPATLSLLLLLLLLPLLKVGLIAISGQKQRVNSTLKNNLSLNFDILFDNHLKCKGPPSLFHPATAEDFDHVVVLFLLLLVVEKEPQTQLLL
jgi:hypothetical protein